MKSRDLKGSTPQSAFLSLLLYQLTRRGRDWIVNLPLTTSTHKYLRTNLPFSRDTNIYQYPPPFPELQLQAPPRFKRDPVSLTFVLHCVKRLSN